MAIDLVNVAAGTGGFVIHGQDPADQSGFSVGSAGDINGDGFDDLIIGAPGGDGPGNTRNAAGDTYVVFGHAGGFAPEIDLAAVAAGTGGFVIHGQDAIDEFGHSVASAGDLNGDGLDDLIIGAGDADGPGNTRNYAGDTYVVFGHLGAFSPEIDLAAVAAGTGGFVIHGQDADDRSGVSVASAGDINGDGFDDLIVGAVQGDGPGNTRVGAGDTYVVFGHAGGFAAEIDLAAVAAGAGGFVIHGQDAYDGSGWSVSSAGDINGDGFDDLIIGARGGDGPGNTRDSAGDSYVVFGKAGGFAAEIDLAAVAAGTGGFVIHGQDAGDFSGQSVASAGDINGDGFDDLIVGAYHGDGPGNTRSNAGDTYVVFGHAGAFSAEIDLTAVAAGTGGFVIHGQDADDWSGWSASSAGDVNGDGFDDLLIGAIGGSGPGNTRTNAGDTYVVFGHAGAFTAEIDLASVAAGTGGFVIHGQDASDSSGYSVASAGDIDGDGFDDLIIGAPHADGPGNTRNDAGDSYVLFGSSTIGGSIDHVTFPGTPGDDTLTGDAGANDMVGGLGNDTLIGNGGADVMYGGRGDDRMVISDTTFLRVDGGRGTDTLALAGAFNLADTDFRRVEGIEAIELNNTARILTIGPIAQHAFDGTLIQIDGRPVTNATEGIDGSALTQPLWVNLSNDTVGVTVFGGSAADVLLGGSGDDGFIGGAGADVLNGGAGNDTVSYVLSPQAVGVNLATGLGSSGDAAGDTLVAIENLIGSSFNDILTGDGNANTLKGAGGSDTLNGGGNDDMLDGGAGADLLNGGAGNDTYFLDNLGDTVVEGANAGTDTVFASFSYVLPDNVENLTLQGGANIMGFGNTLANTITGDASNNLLDGGAGADLLVGGAGNDTYVVDNAGDAVVENANEGTDAVNASVSYTLAANVENLTLTGGADLQGYGNSLANTLTGNGGMNLLDGGTGADTMLGGANNDVYFVDNAGDVVLENTNAGSDSVFASVSYTLSANVESLILQGTADLQGYGNSIANTIYGNSGSNLLNGGAGVDLMAGGAQDDVYYVDDPGDACFEAANQGNDTVFASCNYGLAADVENLILQGTGNFQAYGNSQANTIYGNGGLNLINGGAGIDLMVGGDSDDIYYVDDSSDSCFELANQGNDTVFASCSYGLAADVESLILQGNGNFQAYGNGQANTIYGNGGSNLINGGAGADFMAGGGNDDVYFVDNAGDGILENANEGNDSVFASVSYALSANVEGLVLQGAGNIDGIGNTLANSIAGNTGNNTLDGGGGADQLTGDAGNDIFVFRPGQANGDVVVDFAGNGVAAGDSLAFIGYGAGATFSNIDATHWQVNYNGGSSHDIITFSNGAPIDPTDYLFS